MGARPPVIYSLALPHFSKLAKTVRYNVRGPGDGKGENRMTFTFESSRGATGSAVSMDPRLQKLVAFRALGMRKRATTSTAIDEVAVVAKVTDVRKWEELSEVEPGTVVGHPDADGTTIVTARIPIARIEHVRTQPFVKSLKAARRLKRTLSATTQETLARPSLLPPGNKAKGGKGVIVGIVDFGCDFAHRNFRNANGKTRVRAIWNQADNPGPGGAPFNYGRLHRKAAIDQALKKPDPYIALGYGPDPSEPAHGTHVMDIAAGNGRGTGVPGMAPQADIIFVEVSSSDIAWQGEEVIGSSFGDSVQLLEALTFIFDEAGTTPCAINVSLGTNGGPHDGTTLVEQGIDQLLKQKPNRAVCIAASNSYADGIHAAGTVPQNGTYDLGWNVASNDQTENEFELWYPGASKIAVEVLTPSGQVVANVQPGASGTVLSNGQPALFIANRLNDPNNHDNTIGIYMTAGAVGGRWIVRLHGDAHLATPFHAWVERDDYGQSTFDAPTDNGFTVGSISCGHETIVVGSYDAHKASTPLSWFSSAGPTRDGREKPEVSAPGHAVIAAKSRSVNGTTKMSGTSMAAPCVTGLCALTLAEAKARNRSLAIADLRAAVIDTARRNPPAGTMWDNRYGVGRVSANAAVARASTTTQPIAGKRKPAKRPEIVYAPEAEVVLAGRATGRGIRPATPAIGLAPKAKPRGRGKAANRRV
jgi:hypothetical protein